MILSSKTQQVVSEPGSCGDRLRWDLVSKVLLTVGQVSMFR